MPDPSPLEDVSLIPKPSLPPFKGVMAPLELTLLGLEPELPALPADPALPLDPAEPEEPLESLLPELLEEPLESLLPELPERPEELDAPV